MSATVGVLAVQGAFALHQHTLQQCGVKTRQVRTPAQLAACDALVVPGGESTVISKMLIANDLVDGLRNAIDAELPLFGTCAGMILLAANVVDGTAEQISLGAIDIDVQRNAYGRQLDSFEAAVNLDQTADFAITDSAITDSAITDSAVSGMPAFPGVFIRAPVVRRVGDAVDVWAEHNGQPVLCREGNVVVSSFHPELAGDDYRVHEAFLSLL